jgi:hypothetical protein
MHFSNWQDMSLIGGSEAFRGGELRSPIGNGDIPAQCFAQLEQRLCIVACSEDPQAGSGGAEVGPNAHFRSIK